MNSSKATPAGGNLPSHLNHWLRQRHSPIECSKTLGVLLIGLGAYGPLAVSTEAAAPQDHVLLLCVDGLHEVDLLNYVQSHPTSAMASLMNQGVHYTGANTVRPSDSFPTFLALVTGGSPTSTGVYYDDSYDRSLWAPGITEGATGVSILFSEVVDKNPLALDGGGGIDENLLPRDPARGGAPVYPHNYLRVNTVFEVVKSAGGRTAYCEKHLSYEIAHGPSGQGVDDFFAPEIAANNEFGVSITKSVPATKAYDDIKVRAVLAQIHGYDHTSNQLAGVPTLFGLNFQAVSVAQRLRVSSAIDSNKSIPGGGGYLDGNQPAELLTDALDHTDASIAQILDQLKAEHLDSSTYVVLVGKHGNSPMNLNRLQPIGLSIESIIGAVTPVLKVTADDVGLVWLANSGDVEIAAQAVRDNLDLLGIRDFYYGESLKAYWADPTKDPRAPDLIFFPNTGVIYTTSKKKIAEHGGGSEDDMHVALVVSSPRLKSETIRTPVVTTQVAPTILQLLGLNPLALQAVVQERTPVLPGFEALQAAAQPLFTADTSQISPESILHFATGQTEFSMTSVQVRNYVIQSSEDLVQWNSFSTNHVIVSGATRVTDASTKDGKVRFYRAVENP